MDAGNDVDSSSSERQARSASDVDNGEDMDDLLDPDDDSPFEDEDFEAEVDFNHLLISRGIRTHLEHQRHKVRQQRERQPRRRRARRGRKSQGRLSLSRLVRTCPCGSSPSALVN